MFFLIFGRIEFFYFFNYSLCSFLLLLVYVVKNNSYFLLCICYVFLFLVFIKKIFKVSIIVNLVYNKEIVVFREMGVDR